jgi:hypothetical protein
LVGFEMASELVVDDDGDVFDGDAVGVRATNCDCCHDA